MMSPNESKVTLRNYCETQQTNNKKIKKTKGEILL